MTKVLNQQLYSQIVYGGAAANGSLRLESTAGASKGAIQFVASSLQIIVNGVVAQITHSNTVLRQLTLPDAGGEIFAAGKFTGPGQLLYSSAANANAILPNVAGAALTSNVSGMPTWQAGAPGQVLTWTAGEPSFQPLPDSGSVTPSPAANNLAYYASASANLTYLTTDANRTLLSPSGVPTWGLLTAAYLSAAGASPLANGAPGNVLTAVGDGNFAWSPANPAIVNASTQFRVPFYSAAGTGTALSGSGFLALNEALRVVELNNQARLRFFEVTANGSNFVDFRAPSALSANTSFVLPAADGASGSVLTSDGAGNLSFTSINSGTVANGAAQQLAFYAVAGNALSGFTTVPNRVLSTPGGTLTWSFITPSVLQTTGGTALGNGTLNQVLVSDSAGSFLWANAKDINGEVKSGAAGAVAYYPASGTSVDDSSFLSIDDSSRLLLLQNQGAIQFFESTASGANYVEVKSPAALPANLSFTWPSTAGLTGEALVTDGTGSFSFSEVGRGTVNGGNVGSLAFYSGNTTGGYGVLSTLTSTASRVLLTDNGNNLTWNYLTDDYLSTTGGGSLGTGTLGQIISSDGNGNFLWTNASDLTGLVEPGLAQRIAFYPASGPAVDDSTFLANNEGAKALEVRNNGQTRWFDTLNSNFVSFKSRTALTSSTTWLLPLADGVSGSVLTTDGSQLLSFEEQVQLGTENAVAYYTAAGRSVGASDNLFYTATGLQAKGAEFTIAGEPSALVPTSFSIVAGDGTGVAGGSIYLGGGVSDALDAGRVALGNNDIAYLAVESVGIDNFVTVENGAILRFEDNDSSNFVGFRAPINAVASVTYTLPGQDGLAGSALATDSVGGLYWSPMGKGLINGGPVNSIPQYVSNDGEGYGVLEASPLLVPTTALPTVAGSTLLVDVSGQLSYQVMVEPLGTPGQLAVYSAPQTVGFNSTLFYDSSTKTLQLRDATAIAFREATANGAKAAVIRAPTALASSYNLTLPASGPTADGQVLSSSSAGVLEFKNPGANPDFEKRGYAIVPENSMSISVIYDSTFAVTPATVLLSWSAQEEPDSIIFLPTFSIRRSTPDGFVAIFSEPSPSANYRINWAAFRDGEVSQTSFFGYFAGGSSSGTPIADIYSINFNTDNAIAALSGTMPAPRSYAASSAALTKAYIAGGDSGGTSIASILSFNYDTSAIATLTATLPGPRDSAESIGTKVTGYIAGGENASSTILSISKFMHATETASNIGVALSSAATARGASNSTTAGYITHSDSLGSLEILSFATEVLTTGPTDLGVMDASVACNDVSDGLGYYGCDSGAILKYAYATDTVATVSAALSSSLGQAGASNSFTAGYFVGSGGQIDVLDFATQTLSTGVNTMPVTSYDPASTATFQSKGVL